MTTLTLLVKASNSGQLKQIDDLLKSEFENLDLDVKVLERVRKLHEEITCLLGD